MVGETFVYPRLGAVCDLWHVRLSGTGLGNSLYTYFHSLVAAESCGARVIAPAWVSLKIGVFLRREYSKRTYWGQFVPHRDEIAGVKKFATLLAGATSAARVEVGTGRPPDIIRGKLNIATCSKFSFAGLHQHREFIRKRLVEITTETCPSWGAGGHIGVHVRLGDFAATPDAPCGERINRRIPIRWYLDRLESVRQCYPSAEIKIFSDGHPHELRELLDRGACLCRTGSDVGDLLALSSSSVLIGSNSTFSYWAAFLGNMASVWMAPAGGHEKPSAPETPIDYVPFESVAETMA
jgi:hypothetical protein